MRGIFFYTIGLGIASGILFRSFFDVHGSSLMLMILMSASLFSMWWIKKNPPTLTLFIMGLLIFCFTAGIFRFEIDDRNVSPLTSSVNTHIELEGIIIREPEIRETSAHIYVEDIVSKEKVLVITDRFEPFEYGDRIRIAGLLKDPESFETDYGRTFNYPGYLRARGVRHTIIFPEVEIIETNQGNWFLEKLFTGKQKFMSAIERAISEPAAGLAEGILLGAKRALGDDLEEAFRSVGIIHIVVLSGYNIMIVAEAVMRLLSSVFRPRMRMIVGIGVITAFAILVGLSATVVRASIMAALVLIARATGREYAVMRALIFAGVTMILINPYLLAFDPGFQLSFLATVGLILVAPIIESRLVVVPTRFGIREFLTATLSTQIFIMPFLIFLVGTFSLVSVLVNVIVLPVVPIAMLLSFLAGIVELISSYLGLAVGFFAYLSLTYIVVIAEQFARLPFASFSFPAFPFWMVCIAYFCIGLLLLLFSKQNEKAIDVDETELDSEYDDWTIEEEKETPVERKVLSTGVRDSFPFR